MVCLDTRSRAYSFFRVDIKCVFMGRLFVSRRLYILQLTEVIFFQKLPKVHPIHKRIRGLMESLTSSREHATFAIAIVENYGRSGKVKENLGRWVARRPCLIVSLMYSRTIMTFRLFFDKL